MNRSVAVLIGLTVLVAGPALAADKASELARPKDFSRDFQVPPAPAAPNAIVLSESFTAGIPGTWQVINNEGEGPEWSNLAGCGESGNYTNGSGDVACVSSDVFGPAEFDTELWTPALDLSSYVAPASLTFTVNYQNFANFDFFEVDVSTNGGGSWTNLLSWNEDHGAFGAPPGENVNLNIGAYAGQPSVIFRFHYFDPNEGDWDWYVQVDDVVVDASLGGCTLALTCPPNVSATAAPRAESQVVTFPAPTPSGTCPDPSVGCVPASGSAFPIGTTAVVCTATSGQTVAQCSFDVTVSQGVVQAIPTASTVGLAALALLLAAGAFVAMRRAS